MPTPRHIRLPALAALIALLTSNCSARVHPQLTAEDIEHNQAIRAGDTVEYVVLLTGKTVTFDESGGAYASYRRVLHGTITTGEHVEIPISEIEYIGVERESHGKALALLIGIPAGFVALVVLVGWAVYQ